MKYTLFIFFKSFDDLTSFLYLKIVLEMNTNYLLPKLVPLIQ